MAKIILGQRPKSFTRTVKFKLLDGSDGFFTVEFKYRTRSEYGALIDDSVARAKQAAEAALKKAIADAEATTEGDLSIKIPGHQDALQKSSEESVAFILDIAESWNLDAPFERAAVEQLVDEVPQAAAAMIETYRLACTEGRLGN